MRKPAYTGTIPMAGDSWPRSSETAMVDWTKIPHIDWALQLNQDMRQMLDSNFPNRHGYWPYVNELVAFLRSKHVAGIWEKITDANHLEKFDSVVSELEFARVVNLGGGVEVGVLGPVADAAKSAVITQFWFVLP